MNIKRIYKLILPCVVAFLLSGCVSTTSANDPVVLEQNVVTEITQTSESASEETVQNEKDFLTSEALLNEATEEPTVEINIKMVGDILLHTPIEKYCRSEDDTYDYSCLFSNTNDLIASADLAIVNEEVIIGGKDLGVSGYPAFNAPFEIGDALVDTGFDVICHGTNHALDKGKNGILNCTGFWEDNYPDIAVLGIYDTAKESDEIYIYEQDGIRIAILNYTYGTNGINPPSDMPYCVSLLQEDKVISDLTYAEENADFTIVCPHWGTEYRLSPDESQKKWAKLFVDNGADLIIGTHPHVIEPIELITNEETGATVPCYYSLGNFVNWTSGTGAGVANRMVGGMSDVTLSLDESGKVYVKDYGVTALVCHLENKEYGITTYKLSDYNNELGNTNAIRSQDGAFSYDYCVNLCNEIWGDLWK